MSKQASRVKVPLASQESAAAGDQVQKLYTLAQWQLIWRKFRHHRVAVVGGYVLLFVYLCAVIAQFLSPYSTEHKEKRAYQPPQRLYLIDRDGGFRIRPHVYALAMERDPVTLQAVFTPDRSQKFPIRLFVHSWEYKLWGFFPTDLHVFGVEEGYAFLLGTDDLGRDLFSRVLHGAQISLSIGLLGIAISFVIGLTLGGISGYLGGTVDVIIQRAIEFLRGIPTLPLWMALSAAVPPNWPPVRVYFGITIVLATIGWTGLARVVRGKLLQLRAEEYVMAAQLVGASEARIIASHMLPGMTSYLIVRLTLAIPGMILGETALSFLGLGLRPPAVSWGVLLQKAQNLQTLYSHPWILIPAIAVFVVVLAFNTFGDGLRDAADPYVR